MTDLEAIFCPHKDVAECCDGCGHFSCPCGLNYDDGYFSGPDDEDEDEDEDNDEADKPSDKPFEGAFFR